MKEWYYVVTKSMLDLGLRDTELNLFAILNGYCQQEDGCYYGPVRELADRCGVSSRETIYSALRSLQKKGLVTRVEVTENGRTFTGYSVRSVQKLDKDVSKNWTSGVQKLDSKCPENGHAYNNKRKEKENKETPTPSSFTPPTFDQVVDYCKSRGFADPEGFADYYLETSSNNGWRKKDGTPVTNWKNNVLVWEKYHKNEVFPKRRPVTSGRNLSTLSPIYQ